LAGFRILSGATERFDQARQGQPPEMGHVFFINRFIKARGFEMDIDVFEEGRVELTARSKWRIGQVDSVGMGLVCWRISRIF